MTEIIKREAGYVLAVDGKDSAAILSVAGAVDCFEPIEDGAWRWHRHTEKPTDHMRMELVLLGEPSFTMIPAGEILLEGETTIDVQGKQHPAAAQ